MTVTNGDRLGRYLDLTSAQYTLATLEGHARAVHSGTNAHVFNDEGDGEVPLYAGLVCFRDRAGLAATGNGSPLEPDEWTRAYAEALTGRLEAVAAAADAAAAAARTVLAALGAGLITAPHAWSADDINDGTMRAYLDECAEWRGCDGAGLWACIAALGTHRRAGAVTAAEYDRHMSRLFDLRRKCNTGRLTPAHEAALAVNTLTAWHRRYREADAALGEPVEYREAAYRIGQADTYARLACYAASLTGPAWSETAATADTYPHARAAADRLMLRLARRVRAIEAHDTGDAGDAGGLRETVEQWRVRTVDDGVTVANTLDLDDYADDTERRDALADAYRRLYLAADAAETATEMVEVWHAADALAPEHAEKVRHTIVMHYEYDRTGTSARPVDTGDHYRAGRELRALVDALDVPANTPEITAYRSHAAALDEHDMHAPTSDDELVRAWSAIAADFDAGDLTARHVAELRRLVNAKIAAYCDGDEHRAAALAARLPGWDRLRTA